MFLDINYKLKLTTSRKKQGKQTTLSGLHGTLFILFHGQCLIVHKETSSFSGCDDSPLQETHGLKCPSKLRDFTIGMHIL